jgi:hypothetical protein
MDVTGSMEKNSEDDVEDDGAPGHDHHRGGLNLEVVCRQTTDR